MLLLIVLTDRRQFILDLQYDPLPDVLQQTDDFVVSKLGQVDAINGADVITHVQLVAPEQTPPLVLSLYEELG